MHGRAFISTLRRYAPRAAAQVWVYPQLHKHYDVIESWMYNVFVDISQSGAAVDSNNEGATLLKRKRRVVLSKMGRQVRRHNRILAFGAYQHLVLIVDLENTVEVHYCYS